jgi:hypothetical protein
MRSESFSITVGRRRLGPVTYLLLKRATESAQGH